MNYTVKSCDLSELTFNESDTLRSILQNVAIILAISGSLGPVAGALVHNAGSIVVILHSALLLTWKEKQQDK